jgi:adenine-specific DNA-methyltransferase
MGSKKAILPFVIEELTRLTSPGDIIVDLMAGTHTIGYAMKNRCRMVANDIQRYSMVIGQTLLNHEPTPRFEGDIRTAFRRLFLSNARHLEGLFENALKLERAMLSNESGRRATWATYNDFCESYPFASRETLAPGWPEEFLLLFSSHRLEAYRTLNKLEPYSLFSLYYANAYVGVRQALEIDSARYAIDKLCDDWINERPDLGYDANLLRCLLLSALISVVNRINPGPGHWAAFPRVSQRNKEWIMEQRRIGVYDLFLQKIAEIETAVNKNPSPYGPHIVLTEDYVAFMREVHEYIRQARVVYLDPPYSQGHYSRFYHLLETLTKYDYPEVSHMGRYRKDRHQSPFAQKENVGSAIGHICEVARDANTTLVISYSQGGVIPTADAFRGLLEKFYPADKIELKKLASVHSKLGQTERMKTTEYLFTCKP